MPGRPLLRLLLALVLAVSSAVPAGVAAAGRRDAAPVPSTTLLPIPDTIDDLPAEFRSRLDAALAPPERQMVQVLVKLKQPPLARRYADAQKLGRVLSTAEQQDYRAHLQAVQDAVLKQVAASGGNLLFRYQTVLNGVFVTVPATEIPNLAALPEVAGIYPARPVELHHESSVPFIGADWMWSELGVDGTGVRVAVIDTGIDYTHAALGGSGDPADYANNDPTVIEEGTFPTARVVGGYDLVGDDYDASDPQSVPQPDPDPLDTNGHGTHVAATIGGIGVDGVIGPGVAPGVELYAFKIFGRAGTTSMIDAAIEMAVDLNRNGVYDGPEDRVDVINLSVGSGFGTEIESEVAQNAAELGVVVVASAGNAGDTPYVTGSPATAPDAISVAAAADDGVEGWAIRVNTPAAIAGLYEAVESELGAAVAGELTADLADVGGDGCQATDFDPSTFSGKMALVDRGGCDFEVKVRNAQEAEAVAVIVVNYEDEPLSDLEGDDTGITIPAVMIHHEDGATIREALAGGETVNVTLAPDVTISYGDTLAWFSSRGPGGHGSSFKPDLSAPGVNIFSAKVGTGTQGEAGNGTSMAAPHVAGAAALLLAAHPDWGPQQVKAALMNTAVRAVDEEGAFYPITRQGTGRMM